MAPDRPGARRSPRRHGHPRRPGAAVLLLGLDRQTQGRAERPSRGQHPVAGAGCASTITSPNTRPLLVAQRAVLVGQFHHFARRHAGGGWRADPPTAVRSGGVGAAARKGARDDALLLAAPVGQPRRRAGLGRGGPVQLPLFRARARTCAARRSRLRPTGSNPTPATARPRPSPSPPPTPAARPRNCGRIATAARCRAIRSRWSIPRAAQCSNAARPASSPSRARH